MAHAASTFHTHPLRWLLKAMIVGALPSGMVGFLASGGSLRSAGHSALIGTLFGVVMWGGFEASSSWVNRPAPALPPPRAALRVQARWLLVYGLLLTLCVGLARVLLGMNLLRYPQSFLIASLMGLIISSLIIGYHTTRNLVETVADLERARARAGFLALEAQLSPHTLFNALNTIAALIPEAPAQAEAATEHLARFLRKVLAALEREQWPLSEEFSLVEELLALEGLRFGDRLVFELRLDASEASRRVPPLLLLPLVENALKHGFRPKAGACRLRVVCTGGVVRIEDDGVGRDPEAPEFVGLRTVRQRLEAQGATLRWVEVPQGCAVEIAW